jgi:RNA polymerase II-associated factor 1
VRDYETVKIEQEVPNEFLLVLDDGDLPPTHTTNGGVLERRSKGAYYKNLERKIILKKRRVNVRKNKVTCIINTDHVYINIRKMKQWRIPTSGMSSICHMRR